MDNLTLEECKNYLKKFMEICICQVCHGPLRSPEIAVCTNGHAVCTTCRLRITSCGVCRTFFCQAKPTTLCQMVEVLPRFCRYNFSCNHIIRDNDDHESWCKFRLLQCLYCNQDIESAELLKHLTNVHKYKPHNMVETDFQLSHFSCDVGLKINVGILKLCDGHMFNIHYFYCPNERSLLVFLTYYPVRSDGENTFMVNLEVCSYDSTVAFTFCREMKLVANLKYNAFNIADTSLANFNGKYTLFRTTISRREVNENRSKSSTPVTIDLTSPKPPSSYPTPAKRWKEIEQLMQKA